MKKILILLLIWGCQKPSNQKEEVHEHEDITEATLSEEQMRAVNLELGEIVQKSLTSTVKVNGHLRVPNHNKGLATALYGGVVRSLLVEIGDNVKKGQMIATLQHPDFIRLQEDYLSLQPKLDLAELEVQRQAELLAGQAGAQKNYQSAKSEAQTLLSRKASLEAQLKLMGLDPALLDPARLSSSVRITSPISGTVSAVYAKMGSFVDVSSPIAEIVDNSSLHVDLQVFEKDLPLMKVGQDLSFTLTNNPTASYHAKVFNIGSSFEDESKSIAVHCNVIGDRQGLIDGMNVSALVHLTPSTLSAVPQAALVEAEGKNFLMVQKTPGIFERVEVLKGVSELGFTAVTPVKTLAAGTKIVISGAYYVHAAMTKVEGHAH
jgi:cobalt-zinc-cadmium efflux system membrane fusion protein